MSLIERKCLDIVQCSWQHKGTWQIKFGHIVTMDRISNASTFGAFGSIFKVTARLIMCENISFCTLCPQYFQKYFTNSFQIWIYDAMESIPDVSTFGDCGSIFQIRAELNMWKYCILHLVSSIFPKVFHQWLSNFGYMVTMNRISDVSTFGSCCSIFKVKAVKIWFCTFCPWYLKKYFTNDFQNSDVWWPWTESHMYQFFVTLAQPQGCSET